MLCLGRRSGSCAVLAAAVAIGCADEESERVATRSEPIAAPLPGAYCEVDVEGRGPLDTEKDYLPHVIRCENGGAGLQALKAQAIAARSVVYYNMAQQGSICDGQNCQVYSCATGPTALEDQAVLETAGQYLSYADMLTYAFYVAGDRDVAPPGCVGQAGSTEHWVTYNEGKSGSTVAQTELGYVGPAGFGQNRGCMGQWSARCLEDARGYDHLGILRFFYGDDIQLLTAPGPCVAPNPPAPDAALDASLDSDAGASGGAGGTKAAGGPGGKPSGGSAGSGGTAATSRANEGAKLEAGCSCRAASYPPSGALPWLLAVFSFTRRRRKERLFRSPARLARGDRQLRAAR